MCLSYHVFSNYGNLTASYSNFVGPQVPLWEIYGLLWPVWECLAGSWLVSLSSHKSTQILIGRRFYSIYSKSCVASVMILRGWLFMMRMSWNSVCLGLSSVTVCNVTSQCDWEFLLDHMTFLMFCNFLMLSLLFPLPTPFVLHWIHAYQSLLFCFFLDWSSCFLNPPGLWESLLNLFTCIHWKLIAHHQTVLNLKPGSFVLLFGLSDLRQNLLKTQVHFWLISLHHTPPCRH